MAAGFAPGPALGKELKRLEAEWLASDFQLDKAALLERAALPQPD
jgi:poly(A) polymerase